MSELQTTTEQVAPEISGRSALDGTGAYGDQSSTETSQRLLASIKAEDWRPADPTKLNEKTQVERVATLSDKTIAQEVSAVLMAGKGKGEWTMVFDLTLGGQLSTKALGQKTNERDREFYQKFPEELERRNKERSELLDSLKAMSKSSPVTLIAQDVDVKADGTRKLNRWLVRNGEVKEIPTSDNDQGLLKNVSSVLKLAQSEFPSNKIGLVWSGHGMGNQGLYINSHAFANTPEQFSGAIREGLGNDKKLDVVLFHSCSMAQVGVMDSLSSVARNVLASADQQYMHSKHEMTWIDDLLRNPAMDGKQLSKVMVEEWQKDRNGGGFIDPLRGLAAYNLEEPYTQFRQSLDQFGQNLSSAMKIPGNREEIQRIIQTTTKTGGGEDNLDRKRDEFRYGKRNILDFTRKLVTAIDEGKVKDPEGGLKLASNTVLRNSANFISASNGEALLSAYLPGAINPEQSARLANPIFELQRTRDIGNLSIVDRNDRYYQGLAQWLNNITERPRAVSQQRPTQESRIPEQRNNQEPFRIPEQQTRPMGELLKKMAMYHGKPTAPQEDIEAYSRYLKTMLTTAEKSQPQFLDFKLKVMETTQKQELAPIRPGPWKAFVEDLSRHRMVDQATFQRIRGNEPVFNIRGYRE